MMETIFFSVAALFVGFYIGFVFGKKHAAQKFLKMLNDESISIQIWRHKDD